MNIFSKLFGQKAATPVKAVELAANTNKTVFVKEDKLTVELIRYWEPLYRKELNQWLQARQLFYAPDYPSSYLLQQVYSDAVVGDAQLRNNMRNRKLRVLNKSFSIKKADGSIDVVKSNYLKTEWFRQLVSHALDSIAYGYSLVWIDMFERGNIKHVTNINRQHVLPQKGLLLTSITDTTGLNIYDYPNQLLLFAWDETSGGLLETASALTILKRHSWASWDEFEQLFGVPLRVARTADSSDTHRKEMEGLLANMGSAAYAVLPKSVELEIKENSRADAFQVFDMKRNAVNEEISYLFNGQTMTMQQGSSRSQSETHLKTQDEITADDITMVETWFNSTFVNIMINYGYKFDNGDYLDITDNAVIPLQERAVIDEGITRMGHKLSKEYIESTYNVQLDDSTPANTPGGLSFFD